MAARRLLVEGTEQEVELPKYNSLVRTNSRANEESRFATMKLKLAGRKSSRSDQRIAKMKARTVSLAPTLSTMVYKECRPLSQRIIIKT